MVWICLQARILVSFVTRAMPSANAVAPMSRSQGSPELPAGSWLASTATFTVTGRIAVSELIFSTKASTVPVISRRS